VSTGFCESSPLTEHPCRQVQWIVQPRLCDRLGIYLLSMGIRPAQLTNSAKEMISKIDFAELAATSWAGVSTAEVSETPTEDVSISGQYESMINLR